MSEERERPLYTTQGCLYGICLSMALWFLLIALATGLARLAMWLIGF